MPSRLIPVCELVRVIVKSVMAKEQTTGTFVSNVGSG